MDRDTLLILRLIESHDPDGGDHEPTEAEHAVFKRWALGEHGRDIWTVYARGGWAPESEV